MTQSLQLKINEQQEATQRKRYAQNLAEALYHLKKQLPKLGSITIDPKNPALLQNF